MFVRTIAAAMLASALSAAPASAVGLGPLSKSGITDSAGKAFYLTLSNPYDHPETFEAVPVANDSETRATRVIVFPPVSRIRAKGSRRLLVIVNSLDPGERYAFRVCAARPPKTEETVYARVCSRLVARRLPARG